MSKRDFEISNLSGRTVVITGANSGIGRAAAQTMAGAGARVVLAVRDTAKGEEAAAGMTGETEVRRVDLADLGSVRAFAGEWSGPIDILVNNAGIMAVAEGKTTDGFERQIGTNHLGPFALTNLLLPHVADRVVTVSSTAHRMGRIDLADLNWESRGYNAWRAYGQSKLANLLFTLELQRRLTEAGSPVRALAAHPGYASTNLQSQTGSSLGNLLGRLGNHIIAQSQEQGSEPTVYAATQDIAPNSFVGPDGVGEVRGKPRLVGRTKQALDADTARGLWDLSEQLTGVTFPTLTASPA